MSSKEMLARHESEPLRKADFPSSNCCAECKRIAGTVWLGSQLMPDVPEVAGKVFCLNCISETQPNPAKFMADTLKLLHPISRQLATLYRDQFKEDELV
jgi:hypothetical protein